MTVSSILFAGGGLALNAIQFSAVGNAINLQNYMNYSIFIFKLGAYSINICPGFEGQIVCFTCVSNSVSNASLTITFNNTGLNDWLVQPITISGSGGSIINNTLRMIYTNSNGSNSWYNI
jgi:hypothetical protein